MRRLADARGDFTGEEPVGREADDDSTVASTKPGSEAKGKAPPRETRSTKSQTDGTGSTKAGSGSGKGHGGGEEDERASEGGNSGASSPMSDGIKA